MKDLQPVKHNNQRVLTTQQLAAFYGTDPDNIKKNFSRNKDRYIVGKHYFYLEGEELKEFLYSPNCHLQNLAGDNLGSTNLNMIRSLYLWTEKGALMHAKSLNTDEAWEQYDKLVDGYYRVKEQLADAMATLGELRGMLHALLQGDVDALAMMKASASLGPAMSNSINAALDILAEEQRAKLFSRLADQQDLEGPKTALRPFDYTPESINARILTALRILGPGWHSSGAITHAGDPVLESIGISRTGGHLYRLFVAGVLLRKEDETKVFYQLPEN